MYSMGALAAVGAASAMNLMVRVRTVSGVRPEK
jgi:hypothetical protein